MNEIFNIDKKQKPLVDIPGFTFVGYHNLQPGVCYYVRKYDNSNNFDFVEAKIVKTGNKSAAVIDPKETILVKIKIKTP